MSEGRAIHYRGAGGVEVIEFGELPECYARAPGVGEVAVKVSAVGLNRADILQRLGLYPAPSSAPQTVPGLEFAGTVDEVGAEVALSRGMRVMGIVAGGAFSTRVVVPVNELAPVPSGVELAEAAAIPEAFFTAYDALIVQAQLSVGERVLIHAAASGVGTAAVQLAARAGAIVIGTSRSADKLEAVARLGLTHGIHCATPSFADRVREICGEVDVVVDLVGGAYFAENLRALATRGRMIMVGLLGGARADANLAAILAKRLKLRGTVLRSRPAAEKAALTAAVTATLVPLFERRQLLPVVDTILPMSEIAKAHSLLELNATSGKVVLRWE